LYPLSTMMVPLLGALLLTWAANADENKNYDPLPPKVLFHMGNKKHLLEDDRLGNIPDDVWEKNIMGKESNFKLMPYRRGLYGGKNFDSLELYANSYLGSPGGKVKVPWPMKIILKDECLKPENVTDLATDDKYLTWLFQHAGFLAHNVSYCLNLKSKDCRDLLVLTEPINKREEDACDEVMQKLIVETKAKVVRDTTWDASWYLRDRACIESLEAKPSNVLEMLADAKWDRASRLDNRSAINGHGMGTFFMLISALADSEVVDKALLQKIREKTLASDIRLGPDENSELWVKVSGPAAIDAYRRCTENGRFKRFQEAAQAITNELNDPKLRDREVQKAKISFFNETLHGVCR